MALRQNIEITKIYRSDADAYDTISRTETEASAYVRIESLTGGKELMKARVCIYSADKRRLLKTKVYTFYPSVAEDSANFIKQGYEYLKTLPEFAGAADC